MLTLHDIRIKNNFSVNFLNYFTTKSLVQSFVAANRKNSKSLFQRPHIPFHIKTLITAESGYREIYQQIQLTHNRPSINETKWCLELNIAHNVDE